MEDDILSDLESTVKLSFGVASFVVMAAIGFIWCVS
jgi:hypothetical protein